MDDSTIRRALAQSGLVPIDAQVLLAHVLDVDRAWLVAHATDPLPREAADAFFGLAKRRREGEPVAYLTGHREFHGLDLVVTPAVLIPRPETETLVGCALERLTKDRALRALDLGTGSGAIALAIAHARPRVQVIATDVSDDALVVARRNGARLGLANVAFFLGDWYDALAIDVEPFDAIVANPPYVAAGDAHLGEGDLRHEPAVALSPGGDGLDAMRAIVAGAASRLKPGGTLAVEHGHDQAEAVRALFEDAGFTTIEARRDLAGISRVVAGRTG
ncbi:MAG: peptide chain release factor N(5)-glutamine methyltransferase [Betaproteobacteria bacterium]